MKSFVNERKALNNRLYKMTKHEIKDSKWKDTFSFGHRFRGLLILLSSESDVERILLIITCTNVDKQFHSIPRT
jgi:hypothetical protein